MIEYPSGLDANPANLGGKGQSLVVMSKLGLMVPPAFIIPVGKSTGETRYNVFRKQIIDCFAGLEDVLYSVRSGAPVSMPGMCDTFLHVGVTPDKAKRLAHIRGKKFATYIYEDYKKNWAGASPKQQIISACDKVADSWDSKKAKAYRKAFNVPDTGTAIIIQQMVFGIDGGEYGSGSGVYFSHDLTTGKRGGNGAFVFNESGEALVNGSADGYNFGESNWSEWSEVPHWFEDLRAGTAKLEEHYQAPVDVEFTVDCGELFFLQARPAKLTAQAKLCNYKMPAVDITSKDIDACAVSKIGTKAGPGSMMTGTPIAGGAVTGFVARSKGLAEDLIAEGKPFIFVRHDTKPEDLPIMLKAEGFVTEVGSHTSHAALCARALNLPCVINVNIAQLQEGATITICGSTGRVFDGHAVITPGGLPKELCDITRKYLMLKTSIKTLRAGPLWGEQHMPNGVKRWHEDGAPTSGLSEFNSMLTPTPEQQINKIKDVFEADVTDLSTTKAIQNFLGEVQNIIYETDKPAPPPYIEQFIIDALQWDKGKQ